jgi:hypothetical protein
VRLPGCAISRVGRSALLQDEAAKDLPHDHHGKPLLLEAHPKDAPRLIAGERAKLFDLLYSGSRCGVEPEFLRLIVESQVFDIL